MKKAYYIGFDDWRALCCGANGGRWTRETPPIYNRFVHAGLEAVEAI